MQVTRALSKAMPSKATRPSYPCWWRRDCPCSQRGMRSSVTTVAKEQSLDIEWVSAETYTTPTQGHLHHRARALRRPRYRTQVSMILACLTLCWFLTEESSYPILKLLWAWGSYPYSKPPFGRFSLPSCLYNDAELLHTDNLRRYTLSTRGHFNM